VQYRVCQGFFFFFLCPLGLMMANDECGCFFFFSCFEIIVCCDIPICGFCVIMGRCLAFLQCAKVKS